MKLGFLGSNDVKEERECNSLDYSVPGIIIGKMFTEDGAAYQVVAVIPVSRFLYWA